MFLGDCSIFLKHLFLFNNMIVIRDLEQGQDTKVKNRCGRRTRSLSLS
jgi:hypothetical protein